MTPESRSPGLGSFLRVGREARGLTIGQVEQQTRIPRHHLEALEAELFAELPAPVFTRGLVRSYALFLGADVHEAERLLSAGDARRDEGGVRPAVLEPPRFATRTIQLTRVAVVLVFGALIGAALYAIVPRYQRMFAAATASPTATVSALASPTVSVALSPTPVAPPTSTATPRPSPTPEPTPTLSASAGATATAAANVRGVTIEARVLGRVWSQVEEDGQVVFSGILQPSERRVWRAERRLVLHVGNGALVELNYNGQNIGPAGPADEVVRLEWTSSR
ncbi:MAG: helix-turn-helix domain-containing protein [Chloroflexota bacterium]|nr:MAG: helix-turn-helix domain-containing protein [Chloroflexota bacterium]